jgi:1-acyl-sn-glycerol-3-phosphate acyltransferase
MKAGRLQSLVILLRSVYLTLRITVVTLAEVYRGVYARAVGDQRLRWWSRRLLELVDVRWRVVAPHGVPIEPGRPTILMSNHSSLYDIPLIFVGLPGSIRMLTKKELFRVPIWGRGLAAGEFISIDRHDHRQALRDLEEAKRKMASGIMVWIAPEGTRSRSGELGGFKKGGFMLALQTGATIIPVGIRGAREVLPPKTFAGVRLGQSVEIHVGRAIEASRFDETTRDALMKRVEDELRTLAALPADSTRSSAPAAEPVAC